MKTSNKIVVGVVVVLIAVVLAVSLKPIQTGSVKLGVISSLTGLVVGGDNLGQGFTNGVQLAQEEYKAAGGKLDVSLISEDDGYDSKKGVLAYQKVTSVDHVDALINLSSPTIDAVVTDVVKSGLPVLQLGAESVVNKDNIFQVYPDQTAVGKLADLANNENIGHVTVVMEQIKAYEKFLGDFTKNYKGKVEVIRIPTTERDLSAQALKIKEQKPDAIVFFTGPEKGGQLIKRMNDFGYTPKKMYYDVNLYLGQIDYIKILGSLTPLEGGEALWPVVKNDESFNQRYEKRFGQKVGMLSGYGYDCFTIMIKTYNKDKTVWLKNISAYQAEGVTGKIAFDENGLRPAEYKIATVKDGKIVVGE